MWAESRPTGFVAIAAGTAAAVRAWGWRPLTTLRHPILWVLHLGYTFVWAGLILRGLSMTVLNAQAAIALHVLTAGGMGLLILGMISRVSLGHTGRPLVASTSMTVAYALIALGATIRALTPVVFASGYIAALVISATLWMSGFALFSIQYWPVLTTPRIDGKVG